MRKTGVSIHIAMEGKFNLEDWLLKETQLQLHYEWSTL